MGRCINLDSSCLNYPNLKHCQLFFGCGWCDMRQVEVPAGVHVYTYDQFDGCSSSWRESIVGPAGRELAADRCQLKISLQSGWTCEPCALGQYRDGGGTGEPAKCIACSNATCPIGNYRESCASGAIADAKCVSCPPGTYSDTGTSNACTTCPAYSSSPSGAPLYFSRIRAECVTLNKFTSLQITLPDRDKKRNQKRKGEDEKE